MSISNPATSVRDAAPRLTPQDVWKAVSRSSFAVLGYVTPDDAPRSSGVVYVVDGDRMFVAVDKRGWKARHIASCGRVAVTVPVRRGGALSLLLPIPPATVSFSAEAIVHSGAQLDGLPQLGRLLPAERRAGCAVIEIRPTGYFVTYGVGVPLRHMREPARSRSRVPVTGLTGRGRES